MKFLIRSAGGAILDFKMNLKKVWKIEKGGLKFTKARYTKVDRSQKLLKKW
ncbi:13277_t:CDS:1, partial [Ambispora leptoticha]